MKTLCQFVILIVGALLGLTLSSSAMASQLIVSNTKDSGIGSLRYMIELANQSTGVDTIAFNIPGTGVHTIELLSALPPLLEPIIIDGTTQTGANCSGDQPDLRIELSGQRMEERASGLKLMAQNSVIRGLVINRFAHYGIELVSPYGGNRIECNFIGTDVTGTEALGNGRSGIRVNHSPDNVIGSFVAGQGNVISGNRRDGLVLLGSSSVNNVVIGNRIGTDVTGMHAVPNHNIGVFIDGASYNQIGGTDVNSRNIISGNGWEGLYIYDSGAYYNIVTGNYIGTDITGQNPLGNTDSGIVISGASHNLIGGVEDGAGNVISGNGRQGILIFAPTARENRVLGNMIGADHTGTQVIGNGGSGIVLDYAIHNLIGGEISTHQNLIAGNAEYGIYVLAQNWDDNEILSNILGEALNETPHLKNKIADMFHRRISNHDET